MTETYVGTILGAYLQGSIVCLEIRQDGTNQVVTEYGDTRPTCDSLLAAFGPHPLAGKRLHVHRENGLMTGFRPIRGGA